MYMWSNAFAVLLATLNTSPCFAGHCDWRIPNIKELQSIADYGRVDPASSVPGSTAADYYWSSTTLAISAGADAWLANFNIGGVLNGDKTFSARTRAVRGGR